MNFNDNSTYIRSLVDDIYEQSNVILRSRQLPEQLLEYFAELETNYQEDQCDKGYQIDEEPEQPVNPFHRFNTKVLYSFPCSNTLIHAEQTKQSPEPYERFKTEHFQPNQVLIKQKTMFLLKPKPELRVSPVTKRVKLPAILPKLSKK